jgi:RecJ-like exonuclease
MPLILYLLSVIINEKRMPDIKPEFWEKICEVSKNLADEDDFLVVSHHDADGVTACAILVELLTGMGKNTDYMILKQLDSTTVAKVKERTGKTVVFTDMGSGQQSMLKKNGIEGFYIIDHHPPEAEYINQINPHFFGYDGGSEISASGLCYLTAKSLGDTKMAHIAMVGAVGDMQDSEGEMKSLNRIIMEDASSLGLLKVRKDLRLFGRQSRPLIQMLTYASDPVLPWLTGDEAGCTAFLEGLEIPLRVDERWRNYVDLSSAERNKLISALYMHLLDYNIPEYIIQGMIGDVYTLLHEQKRTELRDAKEYASLLNACGRQERPEIGLQVCLGDRGENWYEARIILKSYREALAKGIRALKDKGMIQQRENLYYFDACGDVEESIVGVVAGMAYGARIIPPDKPVLAFADDRDNPEMMKVSGRGNRNLTRRGLNLGVALREESRKCGGEGGGHDIAAGARIKRVNKEEFLTNMDKKIGEQLGKNGTAKA